jgi:hypothetical protein
VVWRGGPGSDICLRSIVASSGVLTSAGPTIMARTTTAAGDETIVGDVSGIIARAHGGLLCVMYADRFAGCAAAPQEINWYSSCTIDGTNLWGPATLVWHSDNYDACFGGNIGSPGNPVFTNDDGNGTFGFDIAPDGTLWAAVHESRTSIRVLNGGTDGASWTTSGPLGNSGTFGGADVGQPWLAVDLAGNVGLTYYRVTSAGSSELRRTFVVRDASAGTWSLPTPISDPFVPNLPAGAGSVGAIGEFQALTLVDPRQFVDVGQATGHNSFFAAWTETDPMDSTQYRIEGARIGVTP